MINLEIMMRNHTFLQYNFPGKANGASPAQAGSSGFDSHPGFL
ncbi:hypothetical protein N783_09925 [Pontibacillus marinus BH030004 = DSM 16465]|uniref:Uncharacterized protein n=1 Tax=Pontibacillus marinus BH030004 = DSM 16465 TaxID=1385511 RepID=A0A0A5HV26_9BACI|nr:hypothetical protein N783_09925 [Pontibacillus marinus BH030004 = DSM 16465]